MKKSDKKILIGIRFAINVLVAGLCGSSTESIVANTDGYKIMLCIAIFLLAVANVFKLVEEETELK